MRENISSHPTALFYCLRFFNRWLLTVLTNDFIVCYEATDLANHINKPNRSCYKAGNSCLFLEIHPTAVRTACYGETSSCNPEYHDNSYHLVSPFQTHPSRRGVVKNIPCGRDCSQMSVTIYWSANTASRKLTFSASIIALIGSHDRLQTKQ